MLTTNVTHLRGELQKYIQSVQRGEHVIVTSHGKPVARILPIKDAQKEAQKALLQLRQVCQVGDVVNPIGDNWDVES